MNHATRIYSIVQFFNTADRNISIQSIWEKYLSDSSASLTEEDVFIAVQSLLAEIKAMELQLKSIDVPEALYEECMRRLRTAFSPTQLVAPWNSHSEQIERQATPLSLQWAGWVLNQFNENEIDETSLQELMTSLKAQEALLKVADLPIGLREILARQTKALRRAIQLYRITGAEPVRKVVTDAYGELITAPTTLATEVEQAAPSTKEALQKGMQLIGKTAEIADKGSKIIRFGKEIYELGKTGYQIGQTLFQLMPPSGST